MNYGLAQCVCCLKVHTAAPQLTALLHQGGNKPEAGFALCINLLSWFISRQIMSAGSHASLCFVSSLAHQSKVGDQHSEDF